MPQLEALHAYLQQITAAREIPGAVLYVGQGDETLLFEAYGDAQWIPAQRPMTRETYFDLASLTKVS
ncbi:MAG: serine hydrolase, partial [Clostridia bacterium]